MARRSEILILLAVRVLVRDPNVTPSEPRIEDEGCIRDGEGSFRDVCREQNLAMPIERWLKCKFLILLGNQGMKDEQL